MHATVLLMGLALGNAADAPECRNPPSRVSESYWAFVEACGCSKLDAPSKSSQDYDRFLKACSQWRERNPRINVVVPDAPPVDSAPATSQTPPSESPECRNPPSRSSASYWSFIESCGCSKLDPPSKTSPDYERFLKACSQWRQRNPQINVVVPGKPSSPSPTPTPTPKARPNDH